MVDQTAIDGVIAELTQLRKDRPGIIQRLDKMIAALGGAPAAPAPAPAPTTTPSPIPVGAAGH